MTDQNNAAQPGLTDDEILDAIKAGVRAARDEGLACAGPDNYVQAGALALLSKLRAEGVQAGEPVADERCKRCGGPGWYTSHTTGYPHSMPCSACNPRGLSAERLAKDPFLAAQLWRKPADGAEALLGRILEHVSEYGESMASSTLLSVRSIARRNVETRIAAELAALASAPVAGEQFVAAFPNGALSAVRFHELWERAGKTRNGNYTLLENLTWQVGQFGNLVAQAVGAPVAGEARAIVYPPDGTESPFTVINLGSGAVQMGPCLHDGRIGGLWFGKDGQGMGHEQVLDRHAHPGETIAVVTFANVEGLDVMLGELLRCREQYFPDAKAAPQASEAVRNAGIELAAAWVDKRRHDFDHAHGYMESDTGAWSFGRGDGATAKEEYSAELAEIAEGLRALKTQANKDGGDCAKGAGGNLLDYAMAIAHERELDVLGHKHNSDEAVDRFKAAVERALSPTPALVKQSLTATQTGEKGESDEA